MLIRRILIAALFVMLTACADTTEPVQVTRVPVNNTTPHFTATADEPVERPTPTIAVTIICECLAPDYGPDYGPDPRVSFEGYLLADIPTLDPQLALDKVSQNYIENLFVQLTNFDLSTNEIVPEAATRWEISEDGRLYTFHLRTDIPWVYHNPITGETTQEVDEEDAPRFVNAYDFAYGIRRLCDPEVNSDYGRVVEPLIVGCERVLNADNPEEIPQELLDSIGVQAIDEATLTIELNAPASHFLSMTAMGPLSAVPSWTIEEFGEEWIEAGNIVTNGRFVLYEWVHMIRNIVLRNPLMPLDMRGTGNIELHQSWIVPDNETGYGLWQNNVVSISVVPEEEIEEHLEAYPAQTIQIPDLDVFFISFQTTIPPFDNVHVRRAFSAAFDREKYIDEWRQGQGLPMIHLTPPGIIGAPPIDEIGVGFDPEFARAELAAAGYPNCEGFPQVTLAGYTGQTALIWVEFALEQWQEHLGCTRDQILLTQPTYQSLERYTLAENSDLEGHHMFTQGWGASYADPNNWVGDLLRCNNGAASTERPCNGIDDLMIEASQEVDPVRRVQLYRQIEEAFFGPEGEYPLMPIFVRAPFYAVQSWYDYTPVPFYGDQWYNDSIDMAAKDAYRPG